MHSKSVYLFGTCLIDTFYPEAGLDSISLLELCGYQTIFPQAQTCCGQPPYNSGEENAARAAAWHTIETFSEQQLPLIVPSASCAGMIKRHYPSLFERGSVKHTHAINLSERTFELVDFIEDKIPYQNQTDTKKTHISLHRSCSSLREMKVADKWLSILSRLDGVEASLPKLEEECCGFGGTFSIKSPDISAAMTADKCKHLLSEKPDCIVSGDCGCIMNIDGHLNFSKQSTPTLHIAHFVAKRFGIRNE
jgi:L-lactate dehydrogenase complex protein LldE